MTPPARDFNTVPDAVRPVGSEDLSALREVIGATGLFPPDMLDGMMAGYLRGETPNELWFTNTIRSPSAIAYCAAERMTVGTWNLLLIAVHPERQREGLGAALVRHIEAALAERGAHLLLVETSALPGFDGTRAFYARQGFAEEGRIRDFYQPEEDKVVFRKRVIPR